MPSTLVGGRTWNACDEGTSVSDAYAFDESSFKYDVLLDGRRKVRVAADRVVSDSCV